MKKYRKCPALQWFRRNIVALTKQVIEFLRAEKGGDWPAGNLNPQAEAEKCCVAAGQDCPANLHSGDFVPQYNLLASKLQKLCKKSFIVFIPMWTT